MVNVAIDGVVHKTQPDELLIDLINRTGGSVPHVCYHPQLGPIQTCDTSSLRGLAAAIAFLQAFGRHLHSSESRTSQT